MTDHPAQEFILTNLSFNVTQLKDLEFICELAACVSKVEEPWVERAQVYRKLFARRISELEAQLEAPLRGHVSADHKKHGV